MDDRTRSRARNPLPEEKAAGTDDALSQAEAVLGESDERQLQRTTTAQEHRASDETVEKPDHQAPGGEPPSK